MDNPNVLFKHMHKAKKYVSYQTGSFSNRFKYKIFHFSTLSSSKLSIGKMLFKKENIFSYLQKAFLYSEHQNIYCNKSCLKQSMSEATILQR